MFEWTDDPVEIAWICIGTDKGKWWADLEFGTILWQLKKEKVTAETPRKVEETLTEAVGWMVPAEMITSFEVIVEVLKNRVNWKVSLILPDKTPADITGGYNGV